MSIKDTGQGIPSDHLSQIFDPYFTTKPQEKGTGLGLSVVHGIIQDCCGEIRVESKPGEGTTFFVYFPITMAVESTSQDRTVPQELRMGNERILIVDDEPIIVKFSTKLLKQLGYRVTGHTSSIKAIQAFKDDPFAYDLIVTDMTMPGFSGIQLARQAHEIRPDIPVILCTGFSDQVNAENINTMDIQGFLSKPIESYDLSQTIQNVLD